MILAVSVMPSVCNCYRGWDIRPNVVLTIVGRMETRMDANALNIVFAQDARVRGGAIRSSTSDPYWSNWSISKGSEGRSAA